LLLSGFIINHGIREAEAILPPFVLHESDNNYFHEEETITVCNKNFSNRPSAMADQKSIEYFAIASLNFCERLPGLYV
jgi:hypothetical protein